MNPYAVGIIASILIYLVIGNYMGRRVRGLDDYYVAGREAPTLLIVGTLVASFLSTAAFLGETGFTYEGHAGVMLTLVCVNIIGYVVGAFFFGRYIRRSRALTVAEYFGKRFNSRRVQAAAGVTIIIGLTGYLLAVTQGASLAVSEVMGIPYDLTLLIVWVGYTSFTFYSGSKGVVVTDTVMFVLFTCVAFVALFFIIGAAGGWFAAVESLAVFEARPGIISWHGVLGPGARWQRPVDALGWGVILGVAWAITVAVSPWQSSRYLMARNEHTIIRSACIASAAIVIIYAALIMSAASINLLNPDVDPPEKVMIWAALNAMPALAGVLLMAGIVAAALSSASTFLSLVGFSAAHDLVDPGDANERRKLRISRHTMLGVGLVILVLAWYQPPAIMLITYFAATLFASSWGPVAFMSVWSGQITADAAFWGIVTGFGGNFAAKMLSVFGVVTLPVLLDPFVIGIVLSMGTILVVSRAGTVTSAERQYRRDMHETPASERDPRMTRVTLRCAKGLMICGALLALLMVAFYALPYHRAIERAGAVILALEPAAVGGR